MPLKISVILLPDIHCNSRCDSLQINMLIPMDQSSNVNVQEFEPQCPSEIAANYQMDFRFVRNTAKRAQVITTVGHNTCSGSGPLEHTSSKAICNFLSCSTPNRN